MEDQQHPQAEKRKSKRLNKQFVVRFQIQGEVSRDWDMILISNISRGGLLFSYAKELKEGIVLSFKINIALNTNLIFCTGRVTRAKALGNSKMYETGVAFTEIKEADAILINNTVEKFLSKN